MLSPLNSSCARLLRMRVAMCTEYTGLVGNLQRLTAQKSENEAVSKVRQAQMAPVCILNSHSDNIE